MIGKLFGFFSYNVNVFMYLEWSLVHVYKHMYIFSYFLQPMTFKPLIIYKHVFKKTHG